MLSRTAEYQTSTFFTIHENELVTILISCNLTEINGLQFDICVVYNVSFEKNMRDVV